MKKIIVVISALLISYVSKAQEFSLPADNQYLADSEFLVAPTYAGIGNNVRVRASGVTQWVGIKDAPDFQSLAGDMRLGNRSGLGLMFYNDKNGYTKQMGGKFTFSHHLVLDRNDSHFVSFGISYILNNFRIDIDKFTETGRPISDLAVDNNRATINHNFEVGVLYRYKGAFASLSASNILDKKESIFAVAEPDRLRNYNLYAGYKYRRTRTASWELEPSVFVQYFESDGRSTSDMNLKFRWLDFEDYYWAGVTYRMLNDESQFGKPLSIGPMVGLKRGMFYFAYGYRVNLNSLVGYNSGTHMVTLGVDIFQGIGGCSCTEKW